MRVVQEILGHSRLSTTADVYSHVLPTLQRDAADRMGVLLGKSPWVMPRRMERVVGGR